MSELSSLFPYLAGVVLSLVFGYVPGLEGWYAGLSSAVKRVVMLALLAVVAVGYVLMACSPFGAQYGVPADVCSEAGFAEVIKAFIAALIANQSTYLLAVPQKK